MRKRSQQSFQLTWRASKCRPKSTCCGPFARAARLALNPLRGRKMTSAQTLSDRGQTDGGQVLFGVNPSHEKTFSTALLLTGIRVMYSRAARIALDPILNSLPRPLAVSFRVRKTRSEYCPIFFQVPSSQNLTGEGRGADRRGTLAGQVHARFGT